MAVVSICDLKAYLTCGSPFGGGGNLTPDQAWVNFVDTVLDVACPKEIFFDDRETFVWEHNLGCKPVIHNVLAVATGEFIGKVFKHLDDNRIEFTVGDRDVIIQYQKCCETC